MLKKKRENILGYRHILAEFIISALTITAFCSLATANAETYISPELVHLKTPAYRPDLSEFEPQMGTYSYTVSWEGIPAAEAVASVEQDGVHYKLKALAKTYSGIDIFYKLRYQVEGTLSTLDLTPVKSTIQQQENSRKRYIEINFDPNGQVETVRVDPARDEVKTLKFDPDNLMLDPLGAAFLARSLRWDLGETKEFDTFNGKSRYLITLTAQEKTTLDINNQRRDVWVIVPTVKNLTYPENGEKLRRAKIYMSADKSRDILKIVSSVFIGSVTTELDSFVPSKVAPASVNVVNNTVGQHYSK